MDKKLLKSAIEKALHIRKNAHAPYSEFKVGAAIVTKSGKIYGGVNVENSSFGATVCAERIALFTAVADGEREFDLLVIASSLNGKAVYPCGICRQVVSDFAKDIEVVLVNSETEEIEERKKLYEIFPNTFEF